MIDPPGSTDTHPYSTRLAFAPLLPGGERSWASCKLDYDYPPSCCSLSASIIGTVLCGSVSVMAWVLDLHILLYSIQRLTCFIAFPSDVHRYVLLPTRP